MRDLGFILAVQVWLVVMISFWIVCQSEGRNCTSDWFGPQCQYKCRCTDNQCDKDGLCVNSARCKRNWFGPSCQYIELAGSQPSPTEFSTVFWLLDDNHTTCNNASASHSVTVTLLRPFLFTWLRLHVNDPEQFHNFEIHFKNASSSNSITCPNMKKAAVTSQALDIHCDLNQTADQVVLTGEGVGSLCSLYISGGRNVALKQNTSQSSTDHGGNSSRAVDGNTNSVYESNSCTHTDGNKDSSKPSWSVSLPLPHTVNRYALYNRNENQYRLRNFILTSFDKNQTEVFQHEDSGSHDLPVYTVVPVTATSPVRSVNITATYRFQRTKPGWSREKYNESAILTLCEMEIYGETVCQSGSYGRECEHACNCDVKNETCFVSTGGCPSGCAAGYHGEGCTQTCPATFYGIDCRERCSGNCQAGQCNRTSGECHDCEPGKIGETCDKNCSAGKYGKDCEDSCSEHCAGGQCHPTDGNCTTGCEDGYTGRTCNETCEAGKYGAGCNDTCSKFCKENAIDADDVESPCHHINGVCKFGCTDGYEGVKCTVVKESPPGAASSAHDIGIPVVVVIVVFVLVVGGVLLLRRHNRSKRDNSPAHCSDDHHVTGAGRGDNSALHVESPQAAISVIDLNQSETAGTATVSPSTLQGIYHSVASGQSSTCISVKDLEVFMTSHTKDFFQRQFMTIPNNTMATTDVGQRSENKPKNRYKNICAYDHSRVHLHSSKDKGQGDYINASFIQGYHAEEKFIASQGPTKTMIKDFVRMLWEQQVDRVVMLTNLVEDGKLKCERYWPEDDGLQLGDVRVELTTTQVFADYTIRRLRLRKEGEPELTMTQFHFTSWPDKEIPTTPWGLVDFEQRVASYPTSKPIVVHCSAGVGRTGTFIALHNVMREAKDTGRVDFLTTVKKLRQDRMNMIQTAKQYEFLHRAAQMALVCMGTTVTSSDIHNRITALEKTANGQSNMEAEFKAICALCDDSDDDHDVEIESGDEVYQNSRTVSNRLKNRLSNVLPKEYYRVELKREKKDTGTYINAVFLPSFSQQNQQILTQLPLPTTINDFWRLVTQYNVALIVAFQLDLMETDATIADYLPGEGQTVSCSKFNITSGPVISGGPWEEQKLVVSSTETKSRNMTSADEKQQRVTHLQCTTTDLEPENLVTLVKEMRSRNPVGGGRTLYLCRDGATYSGLACVLSLLVDRLDNDHRVTIPLVVGAIKAVRPQVIPSLDQYRLLYEALKEHINNSNVYSNFGDTKS